MDRLAAVGLLGLLTACRPPTDAPALEPSVSPASTEPRGPWLSLPDDEVDEVDEVDDVDQASDAGEPCSASDMPVSFERCTQLSRLLGPCLVAAGASISFDSGEPAIRPTSHPVLDEIGALMAIAPALTIEVGVHSDHRGSASFNLRLSQARADSVREYLIATGVGAGRITAVGYGEQVPISGNVTRESRAKNRRVEFSRTDVPGCTPI